MIHIGFVGLSIYEINTGMRRIEHVINVLMFCCGEMAYPDETFDNLINERNADYLRVKGISKTCIRGH